MKKTFTCAVWLSWTVEAHLHREGIGRYSLALFREMLEIYPDFRLELWCYEINTLQVQCLFTEILARFPSRIRLCSVPTPTPPPGADRENGITPIATAFNACTESQCVYLPLVTLADSRFLNRPIILTLHDLMCLQFVEQFRHVMPNIEAFNANLIDQVTALAEKNCTFVFSSRHVYEQQVRPFVPQVREKQCRQVRLAVVLPDSRQTLDESAFEALRHRLGIVGPYLFYPTQVRANKNVETLLASLAKLREKGTKIQLVMTGNPLDYVPSRTVFEKEGLKEAVVLSGLLSEAELYAIYAHAAATTVTTLFEGAGISWQGLESLLMGAPVVHSIASGIPEFLEVHGLTYESAPLLWFKPHDVDALVENIEYALSHRDEILARQRPLLDRLTTRTWHNIAEDYYNIMVALCRKPRRQCQGKRRIAALPAMRSVMAQPDAESMLPTLPLEPKAWAQILAITEPAPIEYPLAAPDNARHQSFWGKLFAPLLHRMRALTTRNIRSDIEHLNYRFKRIEDVALRTERIQYTISHALNELATKQNCIVAAASDMQSRFQQRMQEFGEIQTDIALIAATQEIIADKTLLTEQSQKQINQTLDSFRLGFDTIKSDTESVFHMLGKQLYMTRLAETDTCVMHYCLFGIIFVPKMATQLRWVLSHHAPDLPEAGTRRLIDLLVEPGMFAADIGAGIGIHTLAMAIKVGQEGRVFALEPETQACAALLATLDTNCLLHRVRLYNAGIGPENKYWDTRNNFAGGSTIPAVDPGVVISEKVKMYTLDNIIPADIPLHCIRIDLGGIEPLALEGMRRVLADSPDIAIIAVYDGSRLSAGLTPKDWFRAFTNQGFAAFAIDESTGSLAPCGPESDECTSRVNIAFIRPNTTAEKQLHVSCGDGI